MLISLFSEQQYKVLPHLPSAEFMKVVSKEGIRFRVHGLAQHRDDGSGIIEHEEFLKMMTHNIPTSIQEFPFSVALHVHIREFQRVGFLVVFLASELQVLIFRNDGSGTLENEEFSKIMTHKIPKRNPKDKFQKDFRLLDDNYDGHSSMLFYCWLQLSGYDLSLDEAKKFSCHYSMTPNYPVFPTVLGK